MPTLRNLVITSICLMVTACASKPVPPPSSRELSYNPVLSRQEGVFLLADVCIRIDGVGESGDYFVIKESKYGAESSLNALRAVIEERSYLAAGNIPIRAETTTVCAAKHGNKSFIKAAEYSGSEVYDSKQPIYVKDEIRADHDYKNALSVISTYAFERAGIGYIGTENSHKYNPPRSISMHKFHDAADIIKKRTHASSILFLGVLGKSRTTAKAIGDTMGSFFMSMGTAIATAGLGTGYYYSWYTHKYPARYFQGALIDLESGKLTWSNAVKMQGEAIEPDAWSNPEPYSKLFHDIIFYRSNIK